MLWLMILIIVCLPIALGAMFGVDQRTTRCERFVLVDSAGKERTVLESLDGQPTLRFLDARGLNRLIINESRIVQLDGESRERMEVSLGDIGAAPTIKLTSASGDSTLSLGALNDNEDSLYLTMAHMNKQRLAVYASSGASHLAIDGQEPGQKLTITGGNGTVPPRLSMFTNAGPMPSLMIQAPWQNEKRALFLTDDKGKVIVTFP